MGSGATEIKKDTPDSFVIHEYTAVTLSLMMGSKIIFRQAAWVDAVIDNRVAHVANPKALL